MNDEKAINEIAKIIGFDVYASREQICERVVALESDAKRWREKPKSKCDGGPAFPIPGIAVYDDGTGRVGGCLSVRDWFAGQALARYMARFGVRDFPQGIIDFHDGNFISEMSSMCYVIADAMLTERNKGAEEIVTNYEEAILSVRLDKARVVLREVRVELTRILTLDGGEKDKAIRIIGDAIERHTGTGEGEADERGVGR